MRKVTLAHMAHANGIRGPPSKSLGKAIAQAFSPNTKRIDLSSGDLPPILGEGKYPTIEHALRGYPQAGSAYDHSLYGAAQKAIWRYVTGLSEKTMEKQSARSHALPGISGFMDTVVRISAQTVSKKWQQNPPLFIIIPPLHPHWISAIVELFGYAPIRTIKRTSNGLPDMEDMAQVFRKIDRPFVVITSPDENPSGVCTPNSYLFNDEQTGLLNKIRHGSTYWGILLFDAMYMDLAWGLNAGQRHEVAQAAEELGVRMLMMHSLSKVFCKPGARVGGVSYVGPLDDKGMAILSGLRREVDGHIKYGISASSLNGLIEAYSGKAEVESEIRETRLFVQRRVESNAPIFETGPISRLFAEATIEAGFYGLHQIFENTALPWHDQEYAQRLIDAVQKRLDLENLDTRIAWEDFRTVGGEKGISASLIFALELALHGVQVLPGDVFYPMYLDNGLRNPFGGMPKNQRGEQAIVFRTVIAHEAPVLQEAKERILKVWQEGIDSYKNGTWRRRYE